MLGPISVAVQPSTPVAWSRTVTSWPGSLGTRSPHSPETSSRLAVNDSYPTEWEASLKKTLALKWERQIPGHPGPNGRLGTRQDMEQQLAFMTALSNEVKKASDAGKCFSPADGEVKLPQFSTMTGYESNLPWNIHRWCGYWGRGI